MNGGGRMHLYFGNSFYTFSSPTPICRIFFPLTNPSHVSFDLFPLFHPWSALFTFAIHFIYHYLRQNFFLWSFQNMTIPPHTIRPCQLICCILQCQHVHQLLCIPLSTNFIPHIALTIDLSALLKIATSFSLKHHVSLPCNIADLIAFIYLSFHPQRESFSEQYFSTLSEFLPSHSFFGQSLRLQILH